MNFTSRMDKINFIKVCKLYRTFLVVLTLLPSTVRSITGINADNICTTPPGFQITNLKTGIWSLTSNTNCMGVKEPPDSGQKYNCTISISFCDTLPPNWCDSSSKTQPSVCFHTQNGTGKNLTKSYSAGEFVKQPFKVLTRTGGLEAEFGKSVYTSPNNVTCNVTSNVLFFCNRKAIWPSSISSKGPTNDTIPSVANPRIVYDIKSCTLNISVDYDGACLTLSPATQVEVLSAGTVLIIIFFVSLTVYFVFGSVFNYCRGYEGKEVIPQSEFWTELPILIADGVIFTCRCGRSENQSAYDSI